MVAIEMAEIEEAHELSKGADKNWVCLVVLRRLMSVRTKNLSIANACSLGAVLNSGTTDNSSPRDRGTGKCSGGI
jgi:hypothetical protein